MRKEVERQYAEVSEELRELWNVELDLLNHFAEICDKYQLKWFVDGGTLLGAVRHHGFIPWDDDVDVIMPYDDYCKFCELANEFSEPYFLQTWKTQEGWRPFLCRLRRSDTTGYHNRENDYPDNWNKGIFIDIFAMSYIPDNRIIAGLQFLMMKTFRFLYFGYEAKRDKVAAADNKYLDALIKQTYFLFNVFKIDTQIDKLSDLYVKIGGWQKKASRHCGPLLFRPYSKGLIWESDWYKNTKTIEFMDLSVPSPSDYDSRLTCQYGDYMTPVKAPSYHGNIIFDSQYSYKDKRQ